MKKDYTALSKTLSFALRHQPHQFGISLDEEGWVSLPLLLEALEKKGFEDVQEADIHTLLTQADKKRFEVREHQIRALYGHSVEKRVEKATSIPPEYLFHGTAEHYFASIQEHGLLKMKRQYVHLSTDQKTALEVASRHSQKVVLLRINASEAHHKGIPFYLGNENTWLADAIPPVFIEAVAL